MGTGTLKMARLGYDNMRYTVKLCFEKTKFFNELQLDYTRHRLWRNSYNYIYYHYGLL